MIDDDVQRRKMSKADQMISAMSRADALRFRKWYVPRDSGCWEWIGKLNNAGYGQFSIRNTKTLAHRVVFYLNTSTLPDCLDHLCRNRKCVNPSHLEAVTNKVNSLRGISVSTENARRTHCIRGHAFSKENTIIETNPFKRRCRACKETKWLRDKAHQQGKKQAACALSTPPKDTKEGKGCTNN